jgi:Asp-tRNA(Asn)/Glu-tRNA(Gln) amidotransferase A subunit family amidase
VSQALHWLGISELAGGYAAREFTAVGVVEHMLARIAVFDPKLHAYIEIDADGAREAALESDRRLAAGAARPLEGITIAVKANIAVGARRRQRQSLVRPCDESAWRGADAGRIVRR